jgi:hypothetical protein
LDISSSKQKSYGGSQYWLLVVDDCTTRVWSFFLKQKSELPDKVVALIRQLAKLKFTVKFLRMDNAGENQKLAELVKSEKDLCHIKIEFTPPGTPQYNGKAERMFATLWGRLRAQSNAAQFTQSLRDGVWTESGRFATIIQNNLVTPRFQELGSPYKQFHGEDWKGFNNLHRFGFMGVVTNSQKIKAKLQDRGATYIYLGPADDHANDVHRFLNPQTKKVITSRDVKWLNKSYGVWKGIATAPVTSTTPAPVPITEEPEETNETTVPDPGPAPAAQRVTFADRVATTPREATPTAGPVTRARSAEATQRKLLRLANSLSSSLLNPEAESMADRLRAAGVTTRQQSGRESESATTEPTVEPEPEPDPEPNVDAASVMASLTLIDYLGGDFGDVALTAGTNLDPKTLLHHPPLLKRGTIPVHSRERNGELPSLRSSPK